METILSVLLGELVSRSINSFISKSSKLKVQDVEDSLQRVLLRAQVIINEATGRHITNEAMLQQLDMLRDAMYQGNYILDTFRYQSNDVEDAKDPVVSHSFPPSKVNSLKWIYYSSNRKTQILEPLQDVLDNLNSMILDVKELVVFLASYPRIYRQPYSMHLLLSNCMFGRQMEAQLVTSFLLHTQPGGSDKELEVLPIVGPYRVGKSTLVSHVCKDERFTYYYDLTTLTKRCAMEHQNNVLTSNKDRKFLVVVELVGDVNEDEWNMFCSSCKQRLPRGSKIIVTSQSDKIVKFGTTPHGEFWYFFKTLTFGTMDPKMHPRFAHVAMEIGMMLSVCHVGANLTASLLMTNFDIHFWYKVLTFIRGTTKNNISKHGGHPFGLINQNKPAQSQCWSMSSPSKDLVLYCDYFERPSHEETPRIRFKDVIFGKVRPHGKFELLSWRSQIPPYYSYLASCEIRERKTIATKRKHSTN
ncbi:hypothetical protein SORBI_3002G011500 [Sorghum bicolor]|uniref:Disease resistance N-terminal domain-containing protein n=1 Tax=Sorghum bicolor TaxID=4558 RepID=C5X7V6_SORBI|nr:hypothetical protein SORBI_3002G011500 [Sorghum bicolor]